MQLSQLEQKIINFVLRDLAPVDQEAFYKLIETKEAEGLPETDFNAVLDYVKRRVLWAFNPQIDHVLTSIQILNIYTDESFYKDVLDKADDYFHLTDITEKPTISFLADLRQSCTRFKDFSMQLDDLSKHLDDCLDDEDMLDDAKRQLEILSQRMFSAGRDIEGKINPIAGYPAMGKSLLSDFIKSFSDPDYWFEKPASILKQEAEDIHDPLITLTSAMKTVKAASDLYPAGSTINNDQMIVLKHSYNFSNRQAELIVVTNKGEIWPEPIIPDTSTTDVKVTLSNKVNSQKAPGLSASWK